MNRLLLTVSLIIIAGCGVKRPFEGRHDPHAAGQINFSTKHLESSTAVSPPIATRDADSNILYVTIPIRSTINTPLYVDYRVSFFDRNGHLISESGWFTRMLEPNVPTNIEIRSTTPRAADFHVDFRPAR